ncbi:RNA methyltransferase, partial [Prevotella histicola]|uniref:RNA methyltransferase n=1 Tax=Prevotella histicola TaxID=470565 RepID=UPI003C716DC4
SMLGVFKIRKGNNKPTIDLLSNSKLVLALDGVQDPGNLGTIIRIADWFGIEDILCSHDTVDCWNPKVVQATMGSIARIKLHYTDLIKMVDDLPSDYPVYATLLDGNNIYDQPLSHYGMIIMGNEGNGISPELRKRINRKLFIPNYPQERETAESLNVAIATSIVCAEFRRR